MTYKMINYTVTQYDSVTLSFDKKV